MLKKNKKNKKKEELPSFLLNLSSHQVKHKVHFRAKPNYSHPIFFGKCKQYHATPHDVSLGGLPQPQYPTISNEDLNSNLFLSKHELIKKSYKPMKIHFAKKRAKEFIDAYPYRRPGVRKAFVPDVEVFTPDFGETTSEIESDTWREIPFCVKSISQETSQTILENVLLSDIKEKNRASLPYKQRMAHYHFPKEFITVKLIGPVIPASITITKIPSKRKGISNFAFKGEKGARKTVSIIKLTENEEIEKYTEREEEGEIEEAEEVEEKKIEEETIEEQEEEGEGEKEMERPDEEKEADEGLENGEAETTPSRINLEEEEEEAMIADEGENTEVDKGE